MFTVPRMKLFHHILIAALVLAVPASMTVARAAAPRKALKPPVTAPAPVSTDLAGDLIRDAQAAQGRGDKDLAIRLAQSAIVADPARPAAYGTLGDFYAANGDADYARFYYREALVIDPADAAVTQALAALDRGDSQQAAKADTNTQ